MQMCPCLKWVIQEMQDLAVCMVHDSPYCGFPMHLNIAYCINPMDYNTKCSTQYRMCNVQTHRRSTITGLQSTVETLSQSSCATNTIYTPQRISTNMWGWLWSHCYISMQNTSIELKTHQFKSSTLPIPMSRVPLATAVHVSKNMHAQSCGQLVNLYLFKQLWTDGGVQLQQSIKSSELLELLLARLLLLYFEHIKPDCLAEWSTLTNHHYIS